MSEAFEPVRDPGILRFGTFELDVAGGTLHRRGFRVHLQEMPLQVLLMLLERPGALVRRDDFYARLWPDDALGILDDNLNTAIAKLRVALDDSPRNPRFIETVPRRGYRFIAPVTGNAPSTSAAADAGVLRAEDARVRAAQETHAGVTTQTPDTRRAGSHFIGRGREMEELRDAFRDCRAGKRCVAVVAGEAGIGKTRIAEEFASEAGALGATVLWGRSLEEHGGQPYWPWVQILRTLIQSGDETELCEDMGACAADIAGIVPELRARLGVAPSDTLANAEHDRFRLFDSIAEYLRRAARRRPLVLVLDNLHWAGKPSLLLLEFVAQSLVDSAVFIAGTYRGSEVTRYHPLFDTLGALNRESHFLRLQLRGLSLEEVADLLARSSGAPWPAAIVRSLHAHTEGNPFFVSEVARHLIEEHVVQAGGASMLPASSGALVVRIPDGVREVICKRLNRLSPECNAMLGRAAVIGREFELAVLRPLLDELREDTLMQTLAEALASGIIEEAAQGAGRYRFTHALIKETLYDELSPAHRPGYHARAGSVLERVHGADSPACLPLLAHHYSRAAGEGCAVQAVKYCVRAAEGAESLLAYEEAIGYYETALEALKLAGAADEGLQCRLLLAAARSLSKAGHVPETIEHVQRAVGCARRLGDVDALVDACRVIDYVVANIGVGGSHALPLIEETLAALGDDDSATRAALLGALTRACYSSGLPRRGEAAMRESLAMARRVGDPKALVSALRARLYARDPADDLDQRLAAAREMLHVAESLGDREAQREAHDMCFYDLIEKGEVEAADEHLSRAGALGRAIRQPFHAHNHMVYRTMRMLLQGRYEEGERLAQEALAAGQRMRCDSAEGIFGMQMFTIRRDQGRLGELADVLSAFTRERSASATWRPGLALMYGELGRSDEARSELEHLARDDYAAIPRDVLWPTCLAYLAEVADFLEDRERAARLYELLRPYEGHTLIVGSCVACLGASSHYLGMLARRLDRPDDAARHFEDALALNTRIGARPWLARTQLRLGTLLAAQEAAAERSRGRELVDASLASARELGMASLERRAGAAQAALR